MTTNEAFWDNAAANYAKSKIKNMAVYDDTMVRTRAHLKPADRALELGCGTGTTALRLHDAVAHLTATDISSKMIAIAKGKTKTQDAQNLAFQHAKTGDTVDGTPFDVVMGFNLLHLIEDLPNALAVIHTMLKPGGMIISKSGCMGEKAWYLRAMVRLMQAVGKAPHVNFLTISELEAQIKAAGFEIVETHTYPGIVQNHFVVARKI